jgi:lysophospholipase L1-like esterase
VDDTTSGSELARLFGVVSPRLRSIGTPVAALLTIAALVSSCTDSRSSAEAPLPTIGLDGSVGTFDVDTAEDPTDVDSVVMIGDSITVGSKEPLEAELNALGFDAVVIEAQNGKRMARTAGENPSGASIAQFITADGEDRSNELWVVALGTNDVNQYGSSDEIAAAVNEVLDRVPDESPLIWVDTFYAGEPDGAALVNSIIEARLERRGNAVIAPWSQFASGDGVMTSDGVHPTSAGAKVFAAVVAATAASFLDR